VCPALTSIRESVVRSNWVATGDAARSYDPLCGLGLTSAMSTAIRAAQTALRLLCNDSASAADYEGANRQAFAEYRAAHRAYYGVERRWPESPFWRRRHQQAPGAAPRNE